MVIASVAAIGLVAGALGVPGGIVLHHAVLPIMGSSAGTGIPAAYIGVYTLPLAAGLGLGGVAVAVAGALLPAGWAARAPAAVALRSE
jgi:putative ABC transport system permease protein